MNATMEKRKGQDPEVILMANPCERNANIDQRLNEKYWNLDWYEDILEYLLNRSFSDNCKTKVQRAAHIRKMTHFSVSEDSDLYYEIRGVFSWKGGSFSLEGGAR
ncbi:hypothetical protein GcM1_227066b [Golovinomyces cichoracearum]|uniref:Uncharacterized protein n=1 Tax=Golovinomyces cichoracearum TaxID=62708 RepID=A0A420IPG5_9PEZI|nr:hypothetical protein GcM1_227066b [Golovinomyces cichoracearum]